MTDYRMKVGSVFQCYLHISESQTRTLNRLLSAFRWAACLVLSLFHKRAVERICTFYNGTLAMSKHHRAYLYLDDEK